MPQLQSFRDDANVVSTDQKTSAATNVSIIANPRSTNIVDQEQQVNNTQTDRLDKEINRVSRRQTLSQAVLTIPSFVVELYYGIRYWNQCPIQPLINIFLIVHGCYSLSNGIVLLIGFITANYIKRSINSSPYARRLLSASLIGQLVLLVFSIAWLVAGQVWVFGAQLNGFQSSNSTQSATYCYSTVFWTGFVIIIVTYAIFLIIILVVVGRYFMKRHKTKQGTVPATDERN